MLCTFVLYFFYRIFVFFSSLVFFFTVFSCSRNNFVGFTSAAKTIRHLLCCAVGQVWAFCLAAFQALMWASEEKKKRGKKNKKGDEGKKATNARARNESNAFSNSVFSQLCCFGFLVDTRLLTSAALLLCQQYRRFIFPLWPAGIVVGVGCPDTSHWGMTSQKNKKKT